MDAAKNRWVEAENRSPANAARSGPGRAGRAGARGELDLRLHALPGEAVRGRGAGRGLAAYWLATVVSAEESSTQVEVAFTRRWSRTARNTCSTRTCSSTSPTASCPMTTSACRCCSPCRTKAEKGLKDPVPFRTRPPPDESAGGQNKGGGAIRNVLSRIPRRSPITRDFSSNGAALENPDKKAPAAFLKMRFQQILKAEPRNRWGKRDLEYRRPYPFPRSVQTFCGE